MKCEIFQDHYTLYLLLYKKQDWYDSCTNFKLNGKEDIIKIKEECEKWLKDYEQNIENKSSLSNMSQQITNI